MPEENPRLEKPEAKTELAKAETKPQDALDTSIRAADKEVQSYSDPEEKDIFSTSVEISRLPRHLQALTINLLTQNIDGQALKIFQEIAISQAEEDRPALPEHFEVSAARFELTLDKKYFSYESAEDGTKTLKIIIPGESGTATLSGSKNPAGDITAGAAVTAGDKTQQLSFGAGVNPAGDITAGAAVTVGDKTQQLSFGAGVNPALGQDHVEGTVVYANKNSGTTLAASAGANPEGDAAFVTRVMQSSPQGTVLTGALTYAQGNLVGTLDYRGSLGNITLTISDAGLAYSGTFEKEIAPGTSLYATVRGNDRSGPQIEATAGARVDLGTAGKITAEGYLNRNRKTDDEEDEDKKESGFNVNYEIPF